LARQEGIPNPQHTTPPVIRNSASRLTSRRTYRCSRSCLAAGAATARRAHRTSDGGDDGSDARGSTTTTVEARIWPMPNSRTTRESSLPPPLLGISRGVPPSRQGGKEAEEEEEAPAGASGWLSRRLTSCRRRLSSSRHSTSSFLLTPPLPFASCTPPLPFASCLPAGCRVAPVVAPPPALGD